MHELVCPARTRKGGADLAEVSADATPFTMRRAEIGLHGGDCSFETILHRPSSTNPVLCRIAEVLHQAAEVPGFDVVLRGLSMTGTDEHTRAVSGPIFDGLHESQRRRLVLGREPARPHARRLR